MLSIKDKLREFASVKEKPAPPPPQDFSQSDLDFLGAKIIENDKGTCLIREKRFPKDHVHGASLYDFTRLTGVDFSRIGKNVLLDEMDPYKTVLFDTETTGLAGGAGTYIFLIGLGYFEYEQFIVKQIFMGNPSQEAAFLQEIENTLTNKTAFISFNGKSYDAPLLKSRFILNKTPYCADDFLHLDILHASRRLWKHSLASCTLQSIEQNILGFTRQSDIPGSEIPETYFNFLRDQKVEPLKPVLQHNVIDIVSMVSISTIISQAFKTDIEQYPRSINPFAIINSFLELDQIKQAIDYCDFYLSQFPDTINVQFEKAKLLKGVGNNNESLIIFLHIIESQRTFWHPPFVEAAKIYEHKLGDYQNALILVNKALERLNIRKQLNPYGAIQELEDEFLHRKIRLEQKCERGKRGIS